MKKVIGIISSLLSILIILSVIAPMTGNIVMPSDTVTDNTSTTVFTETESTGTEADYESIQYTTTETSKAIYTQQETVQTAENTEVHSDNSAAETNTGSSAEECTLSAPEEDITESVVKTEPEEMSLAMPSIPETLPDNSAFAVMDTSAEITEKKQMLAFDREYDNIFVENNERHVYTFTATERGYITYTAKHKAINDLTGWNFILYQEYYINGVSGETGLRVLNVLRSSAESKTDGSVKIGVMPGNYRICVEPATSKAPSIQYTLKVKFAPANNYEIECNDTKSRYTELYTAVPMKGSASYFTNKQDTDWYMFRMPAQGYIDLTFTHPDMNGVTVCWKVSVTNTAGYDVYTENSTLSTTKLSSGRIGLKAGIYYICVSNRVYTDCEYTLTVTRTNADNYETERNNVKSTSDVIPLNTAVYGSLSAISETYDKDWYKFNITEAGYITLSFAHDDVSNNDPGKNGWNVKLLDADGNPVFSTVSKWEHEINKSPSLGLSKGSYYITVDSQDIFRNNTTYSITVKFTASDKWESEPNNSFETADKLIPGTAINGTTSVSGTDFDDDFYKFTLNKESDITITLKSSSSAVPKYVYRMILFNKNNVALSGTVPSGKITTADCKGGESTTVTYTSLPSGTYYIKVSPGLFYDTHKYTITVSEIKEENHEIFG